MTRETKHKNEELKKAEDSKQLTFDEPVENAVAEQTEATKQHEELVDTQDDSVAEEAEDSKETSVKAQTHVRKSKTSKTKSKIVLPSQKKWQKFLGLSVGALALLALLISGVASQYYKNKVMPGVSVASINSGAKTKAELTKQLELQKDKFSISFASGEKKFQPKFEEIGLNIDIEKTVEDTMKAKRGDGFSSKLAFWNKVTVPVKATVNDNLLNQYIETNVPELLKAPQDSQLQFDAKQSKFVVTPQADGEGADFKSLKKQIDNIVSSMNSETVQVQVAKKSPSITEAELRPLVEPANAFVVRKVVLTGLGYSFQARPADIAAWVTPTPQKDGSLKLVLDPAKVQSYVDSISKKISNAPVDRKVIKDQQTGAEVVLQEGRAGTELADKQTLATAIADSLKSGQDVTQTMNITTAAFQTVNMEAYEKWIEVDLSEQRTTAYERATPVKNFLIASGTKGYETVTGEFAIWLKVRTQTMQGGSKADGSYYSIPNVEWVSYFYKDYALHGAWWREKFGYPASHGCVNMTNADAKWVFEWAPVGTKVIVHQ